MPQRMPDFPRYWQLSLDVPLSFSASLFLPLSQSWATKISLLSTYNNFDIPNPDYTEQIL